LVNRSRDDHLPIDLINGGEWSFQVLLAIANGIDKPIALYNGRKRIFSYFDVENAEREDYLFIYWGGREKFAPLEQKRKRNNGNNHKWRL
jgi:hypothetical protein